MAFLQFSVTQLITLQRFIIYLFVLGLIKMMKIWKEINLKTINIGKFQIEANIQTKEVKKIKIQVKYFELNNFYLFFKIQLLISIN